jgi:hypothetical protein
VFNKKEHNSNFSSGFGILYKLGKRWVYIVRYAAAAADAPDGPN